jgi:hypothetical protein
MKPIISSLIDTDPYKFTMWKAMLHRHPRTQAERTFVCRNRPAYPLRSSRRLGAASATCLPQDSSRKMARSNCAPASSS